MDRRFNMVVPPTRVNLTQDLRFVASWIAGCSAFAFSNSPQNRQIKILITIY